MTPGVPSRGIILALIILLSLSVVPHIFHVHPWISVFFFALVAVRLLALWYPRILPGRFLLLLFTVAGLMNVLAHHRLLVGRDAGVALLVSMLGLKLLETKAVPSIREGFNTVAIGLWDIGGSVSFDKAGGLPGARLPGLHLETCVIGFRGGPPGENYRIVFSNAMEAIQFHRKEGEGILEEKRETTTLPDKDIEITIIINVSNCRLRTAAHGRKPEWVLKDGRKSRTGRRACVLEKVEHP